jgi:carbonic anhydrase/acetyltransferase-like protein (isoleucine patch superfamily)
MKRFWNEFRFRIQYSKSPRLKVGRGLRLFCPFYFTGPGRLVIGKSVTLRPSLTNPSHHVTFCTYSERAVIKIGDGVELRGTRFGCRESIEIGPGSRIGESSILDNDFHGISVEGRNDPEFVKAGSVRIGVDVQVASHCFILRGVQIGDRAVVGPMSIVSSSLPPDVSAMGYPARPRKDLPGAGL